MARPVTDLAVLQVSIIGRYAGQRIMNVWHYWLVDPTPVGLDGDAVVTALMAVLNPGGGGDILRLYRTMSNEACDWLQVRCQWISPIRYSYTVFTNGTGPGEVVGQPLPANVAGVVTLRTTDPGPGGMGRKHFSGLTVTDVSGSIMTNDFLVNVSPILDRMGQFIDLAALSADASLVPIVYNKTDLAASNIWTAYTIQDTSRVMRRRTVGVGE